MGFQMSSEKLMDLRRVCDVVEERGLMLGAVVELIRGVPGELRRCNAQLPALLSGPPCRLAGPSAAALHLHTSR
ncbi:hypothetical protein NQZ68_002612 [Dissostichus eleginoides]|nr:hypothetical protein NQZ68_002612 [Dissostichus eleginoides]